MKKPLALLILACACPADLPVTITIANDGDQAVWLSSNDVEPRVGFFFELDGERVDLVPSPAWLCLPECGKPGMVACAELAPEMMSAYALLPGDEVTVERDGGFWYRQQNIWGTCAKKLDPAQPISVEICRGDAAVDPNGDDIPAPDESGVMDVGDGAMVVDPQCEATEVADGGETRVAL
jgi:hypothetical protein